MGKILLTGVSGFIGKHLLRKLCDIYGNENIIALSSQKPERGIYLFHNNYIFSTSFFTDAGYDDIEMVLHVGAFIPKAGNEANDIDKCNANIINTQTLINADLPFLKRFVFISTIDVYGNINDVINENTIPAPTTLYGTSKLYCEKMLEQWAINKKCLMQILRVGHVYGPGEEQYQKIIPATMTRIINGEKPQIWGNGKEKRSFIYIDDVVVAIINSLQREINYKVINVVGGISKSIEDVVRTIIDISGKDMSVDYIPGDTQRFDSVFDNTYLKSILQIEETTLYNGLSKEWNHRNII